MGDSGLGRLVIVLRAGIAQVDGITPMVRAELSVSRQT